MVLKFLKHVGNDSQGAAAVEYGLIVSLIVIAMVGALQSVSTATNDVWSEVRTASDEVRANQ